MKPSAVASALRTCFTANLPAYLWSSPGKGKSSVVAQVARDVFAPRWEPKDVTKQPRRGKSVEMVTDITAGHATLAFRFSRPEAWLIDVRAVLLDPVDLRGLPHVNGDNRAHWCQPDFLPREGCGVLFLDELNAAPRLVQAACYQLVFDRRIGEYTLPDGWVIVAAGNNAKDGAVTEAMPTPLKNRFIHIEFELDIEDWCNWAIDSGIRPEVIAFIRFRPSLLDCFDARAAKDVKAFATPRSWEFVSRLLEADPDPAIELDLLKGTIGDAAAIEFTGFLRTFRELPDIDEILLDPYAAAVPESPAALYAVATTLATRANKEVLPQIFAYLERMPKEFEVLCIRDCSRVDPTIEQSIDFVRWTTRNKAVLYGRI